MLQREAAEVRWTGRMENCCQMTMAAVEDETHEHTWRFSCKWCHLVQCKLNSTLLPFSKMFTWSNILSSKLNNVRRQVRLCVCPCALPKKCQVSQKDERQRCKYLPVSKYRRRETCPAKQVFVCDLSVQLVSTWLSQQNGNCFLFSPFSAGNHGTNVYFHTNTWDKSTAGAVPSIGIDSISSISTSEHTLNGVSSQLAPITGRQAEKLRSTGQWSSSSTPG